MSALHKEEDLFTPLVAAGPSGHTGNGETSGEGGEGAEEAWLFAMWLCGSTGYGVEEGVMELKQPEVELR